VVGDGIVVRVVGAAAGGEPGSVCGGEVVTTTGSGAVVAVEYDGEFCAGGACEGEVEQQYVVPPPTVPSPPRAVGVGV
jgi:hypothetical protein